VKNGKVNHLSLLQVKRKDVSVFMAIDTMAKLKDGMLG